MSSAAAEPATVSSAMKGDLRLRLIEYQGRLRFGLVDSASEEALPLSRRRMPVKRDRFGEAPEQERGATVR